MRSETRRVERAQEHCDGRPRGFIVVEVAGSTTIWRGASLALLPLRVIGCTSIDPGPELRRPRRDRSTPDYFYCHVEPQFIFAKKCGPGEASRQRELPLQLVASAAWRSSTTRPSIAAAATIPSTRTQTAGARPQSNFEQVSLEMSRDYMTAPLFVRPSNGLNHPRVDLQPERPDR